MPTTGALNLKLQGVPAANRDASVKLVNIASGQTLERKPFLDGSLTVRDIDPGPWEVQVLHPNVVSPLFQQRITVLPQFRPTFIPIPIRPDLFVDNPIRDVPDADLTPVQQTATAVRAVVAPIAGKAAGEVIRAEDWNQLASAVSDLAAAVLELTSLVSPRGHDHPEIAAKIDEVQGNVRRFTESFGRSLLELRRDVESQNLRRATDDMLDDAVTLPPGVRDRLKNRLDELDLSIRETPLAFTRKMSATGNVLASEINAIATAQGADADAFLAKDTVKKALGIAEQLSVGGTQIRPEEELETYRRTGIAAGGSKFTFAARP